MAGGRAFCTLQTRSFRDGRLTLRMREFLDELRVIGAFTQVGVVEGFRMAADA